MHNTHLTIDTSIRTGVSPYGFATRDSRGPPVSPSDITIPVRVRVSSNASSTSSLDIISPKSSSTNASTTSLVPTPIQLTASSSTSSPYEPAMRALPEYVLAMHDYSPAQQAATCLSFKAGQVIHVLNRDPSGWWDGELEGQRGWFPSNYVNTDDDYDDEEDEDVTQVQSATHAKKQSIASASSSSRSHSISQTLPHTRQSSVTDTLSSEVDSHCPPIMVPLLHGLSLLQNAVRSNRVSHFQPSTACIISCVRSVLSGTDTLIRDAPVLQKFPALAQERRKILSVLALLVAQAKKASEGSLDDENQEVEVEAMLRLGGQVFARVRGFLSIAVQCGIELPERRLGDGQRSPELETRSPIATNDSFNSHRASEGFDQTPKASRPRLGTPVAPRTRSLSDLRSRRVEHASTSPVPAVPSYLSRQRQLAREQALNRTPPTVHQSSSSVSSISSIESASSPVIPPFPQGPCTSTQAMEALRFTHDHFLSTIAAFIGHAHSHSRTSHASSTGHMYDLVKEIIEMVCKLLTIVEAVLLHPGIPVHRLVNLKAAKEGLYTGASALAEAVRLLTLPLSPDSTEEAEKQNLLRSATSALKAGADCVAAVKMCLTRSAGEGPFMILVPSVGDSTSPPMTPSKFTRPGLGKSQSMSVLQTDDHHYGEDDGEEEDPMAQSVPVLNASSGSESSYMSSHYAEVPPTPPDDIPSQHIVLNVIEPDLASPTSLTHTDDGTTWEGSVVPSHAPNKPLPSAPLEDIPEADPIGWMLSQHDYSIDDVAYNGEGHLVGATLPALVEKMTPHNNLVDGAFLPVFFLTFRLFSTPVELLDTIIARYNVPPPPDVPHETIQQWQQVKGIPVRLRVSNLVKMWVESYWRPGADDVVLPALTNFVRDGIAMMFQVPAQRIMELIQLRVNSVGIPSSTLLPSTPFDRSRDPGMSINPPNAPLSPSEIPRPTMTKTLLSALRAKSWVTISITDFDALELARQFTIMECDLYCAIQPEEVLEAGLEGAKRPMNVRAMSSLSTVITGWVSESILNEHDTKKRTSLVKFFIKVADRCTALHNYSTSRSILAALDSSTISRLHQTWAGIPQKNRVQMDGLRRLADHSRNYHEYRSKLRNTAPPAVPFLGLYLTDVTFCREGNPSHRASPTNPDKKLLNFNKYHKLARIVQDMQRFQVPYNLKVIPEAQQYLNILFRDSAARNGDLQDLYRRSLLVEPRQPADAPPSAGDARQLFPWTMRSQPTSA